MKYATEFEQVLHIHLTSEFEVSLLDGEVTNNCRRTLEDLQKNFDLLQFDSKIVEILEYKVSSFSHRIPQHDLELYYSIKDDLVRCILQIASKVQHTVLEERKTKDNALKKLKCSNVSLVHNFTEIKIPEKLSKILETGLSAVPYIIFPEKNLVSELAIEAKIACRNLFYAETGTYPITSTTSTLGQSVLEIISQCKTNTNLVSRLIDFKDQFSKNIPFLAATASKAIGTSIKDIVSLIPHGCIISPSDKNVGVSILPPSWYLKQYEEQILKGGHELQTMSEAQCVSLLLRKIRDFKKNCSASELKILSTWWPKIPVKKPRIGVMKLVPKVHKLSGPATSSSCENLKSRPIRGAENDPLKDPSKALYAMLHSMLKDFSKIFPSLENDQVEDFTVLKGCDDFVSRLSLVKLHPEKLCQTTLVSADFSDAYTSTGIDHLKQSILNVAKLVKYEDIYAGLVVKLVDLVFLNCYFYTPFGLYRQSKGMPMGDYSSRDSLDVDLCFSEFEILNSIQSASLKVHLYCRLVDDISAVVQGPFPEVVKFLELFAAKYPPQMPLNCQISFGYSRFLDLHIFNMPGYSSNNGLVHTLAYKENSSFSYTPSKSNIHHRYKHASVSTFLHRIHSRCTLQEDIDHHLSFMDSILKNRMQDAVQVRKKLIKFFKKKKNPAIFKPKKFDGKNTSIKFDAVSGRHNFIRTLIKKYLGPKLMISYKSCGNIGSILSPKRAVIRKLSLILNK